MNVLLTRILYSVTPGPAMIRAVYEYCRLIRITVGDNEPNYSGDMYANSIRRITSVMISILTYSVERACLFARGRYTQDVTHRSESIIGNLIDKSILLDFTR